MVPLGRLERPTRGLGNRCSIHLSYRGTISKLIIPEVDGKEQRFPLKQAVDGYSLSCRVEHSIQ